MTEEVSHCDAFLPLLFSAISMSTTSPLSDGDGKAQWTKVSKKPFCCQNGSDWRWRGGERDHQKHLFPLQKQKPQKHQHVSSSALGRRWEENTGMNGEVQRQRESGNRGSGLASRSVWWGVCLSRWVLAHSRWAPRWVEQSQRDWRIPPSREPPPALAHYHTHPEEGFQFSPASPGAWAVAHPPNTNLWGLKSQEQNMPTASVYRTVSKHN